MRLYMTDCGLLLWFYREDKDLDELSQLGHFLKGSSATLGLVHVRDSCEKIQRYGKRQNEDGSSVDDEELCLKRIGETLKTLREEYDNCERALKKFYGSAVSEDGDKADATEKTEKDETAEKTATDEKDEKADVVHKADKTDKADETRDKTNAVNKTAKADD